MHSRALQKKSSLAISLAVWVIVLLTLPGGNGQAAEYAVDKGSYMFGITAGFVKASGDLYESDGESFTLILLMPHVVHFFVRNLGVGGDALVLLTGQGDNKSTTLGVGPKVMYFFGGKESKSRPYLTTGFYYVRNDIDYEDVGFSTQGVLYGTRWKLGIGSSWNISPRLGVLMEVSYNGDKLKHEDTKESKSGNMVIFSMGLVGFSF